MNPQEGTDNTPPPSDSALQYQRLLRGIRACTTQDELADWWRAHAHECWEHKHAHHLWQACWYHAHDNGWKDDGSHTISLPWNLVCEIRDDGEPDRPFVAYTLGAAICAKRDRPTTVRFKRRCDASRWAKRMGYRPVHWRTL